MSCAVDWNGLWVAYVSKVFAHSRWYVHNTLAWDRISVRICNGRGINGIHAAANHFSYFSSTSIHSGKILWAFSYSNWRKNSNQFIWRKKNDSWNGRMNSFILQWFNRRFQYISVTGKASEIENTFHLKLTSSKVLIHFHSLKSITIWNKKNWNCNCGKTHKFKHSNDSIPLGGVFTLNERTPKWTACFPLTFLSLDIWFIIHALLALFSFNKHFQTITCKWLWKCRCKAIQTVFLSQWKRSTSKI